MNKEDYGELLIYATELEERLNKAMQVALHYHPVTDEFKSDIDHLDEVFAFLKSEGLITDKKQYTRAHEILYGKKDENI